MLRKNRAFKTRSTHLAWKHGHDGVIWQPRFYDHFLHRDDDLRQAATYILANSVRRGLAQDWRDYALGGSLVYALQDGR